MRAAKNQHTFVKKWYANCVKKSRSARSAHLPKFFRNKRWQAYFFLIINTIVWGAALPIVKPSLDITTPYRFLLYRFLLAGALTFPIFLYYLPKIKHLWRNLFIIIGVEFVGTTLSLAALYLGLQKTTALEASLITTTTPIFTIIACIWFLHEKEEKHEWLGLVLAFGCTIILTALPYLRSGQLPNNFSLWGNALVLLQNVLTALYFVLIKKYYHRLPKFFVSSVSYIVGAVSFLILALMETQFSLPSFWQHIQLDLHSGWVWLAAVYMAVFGSVIGLTTYFKGQDEIEASEASLFGYLQPAVFIPLSVFFLKEKFDLVNAVLLAGILVGVVISEKRFQRRRP